MWNKDKKWVKSNVTTLQEAAFEHLFLDWTDWANSMFVNSAVFCPCIFSISYIIGYFKLSLAGIIVLLLVLNFFFSFKGMFFCWLYTFFFSYRIHHIHKYRHSYSLEQPGWLVSQKLTVSIGSTGFIKDRSDATFCLGLLVFNDKLALLLSFASFIPDWLNFCRPSSPSLCWLVCPNLWEVQ